MGGVFNPRSDPVVAIRVDAAVEVVDRVTTPYAVENVDDIATTEVSVDPGYDAFD